MRYSAAALAALAFANLSAGQVPYYAVRSSYFCGIAPLGWTPPGQHRRQDQDRNISACHALIGGRSRPLGKRAKRLAD